MLFAFVLTRSCSVASPTALVKENEALSSSMFLAISEFCEQSMSNNLPVVACSLLGSGSNSFASFGTAVLETKVSCSCWFSFAATLLRNCTTSLLPFLRSILHRTSALDFLNSQRFIALPSSFSDSDSC